MQEKGVLMDLLENAQQLREAAEARLMQQQDVEGTKAAEDVVTHVAATQTEPCVVEFATQTEVGGNLELEGHVPALKQSTAERETVRDVEQDKYLGVDDWICKYEDYGEIMRNMPFESTCHNCGTYRGDGFDRHLRPRVRNASKTFVRASKRKNSIRKKPYS